MHFDDEQLQRLLHGELDAAGAAESRAHAAACADCAARLAAAQRDEAEIFALLRRLDHPAPRVDAAAVAARARATATPWLRWAAGVALALGLGGVAYAAPGSPLPALARRLAGWVTGAPPASVAPAAAGIMVEPGARFTIVFAAPVAAGTAVVSLTDARSVAVRTTRGTARFASDVDRLTVTAESGDAAFEIELPRQAPWVEVLVGSQRVLLKDGARVVAPAAADSSRRYTLTLHP